MENTGIEFRKERNFGDIFGSAIEFIRQEHKKFGFVILVYVLPFLVITSLVLILIQSNFLSASRNISDMATTGNYSYFGDFFFYYFLMLACYVVAHTMLITATYGYVDLYVKKGKDGFESSDVWNRMRRFFFPVLGTNIVVGIITIIGFVFCLIPGIYLGISLSLILIALIYENKGFGDAFSRSFDLTKRDWWVTFAIVLVALLLVSALSYVIQLPAIIIGMGSFWTTMQETISKPGSVSGEDMFSTTYIVVTSLLSVLTYILYIIPHLILSFQYFNLVERLEKPSLINRIEQMGQNE